VLPALLRKFGEAQAQGAREVTVWGTGTVRREFLHVDDLADAAVFLMEHYSEIDPINAGAGIDLTIREVAEMIQRVTGFEGAVIFDHTKPDGTPRKLRPRLTSVDGYLIASG
jgi:GDP-L-fucose synthase